MNGITLTGGAKIGIMNYTYPFATMVVSKDKIQLTTATGVNLVFRPQDIVSIKTHKELPVVGQGIRIKHQISGYSKMIIFWLMEDPELVLEKIQATGFLDNNLTFNDAKIERPEMAKIPLKKPVALALFGFWSFFLVFGIVDLFVEAPAFLPKGDALLAALTLMFFTALLTLVSVHFRELILNEGVPFHEVRKKALVVLLISIVMLVAFGFFFH
ncbi:hypothetical protein ACV07N_13970 [Roseivirga echinicomitans]